MPKKQAWGPEYRAEGSGGAFTSVKPTWVGGPSSQLLQVTHPLQGPFQPGALPSKTELKGLEGQEGKKDLKEQAGIWVGF